jgi:hypothetical protein
MTPLRTVWETDKESFVLFERRPTKEHKPSDSLYDPDRQVSFVVKLIKKGP